jgi:hypothetical protein
VASLSKSEPFSWGFELNLVLRFYSALRFRRDHSRLLLKIFVDIKTVVFSIKIFNSVPILVENVVTVE